MYAWIMWYEYDHNNIVGKQSAGLFIAMVYCDYDDNHKLVIILWCTYIIIIKLAGVPALTRRYLSFIICFKYS